MLAFENNFGMLQWVSHEEVTEMCRGLGDSAAGRPEVVFISACYGLTSAQAFVDLGIPHVVSVTAERVLDRASLEFTDAFYSGLFSGKTVAAAFQLGLARLVAQYPSEKDKFRLLGAGGREGQDHDVTLFGSRAAPLARPHFDAAASTLPSSQCYSSANFSLGRLVPMQEVRVAGGLSAAADVLYCLYWFYIVCSVCSLCDVCCILLHTAAYCILLIANKR